MTTAFAWFLVGCEEDPSKPDTDTTTPPSPPAHSATLPPAESGTEPTEPTGHTAEPVGPCATVAPVELARWSTGSEVDRVRWLGDTDGDGLDDVASGTWYDAVLTLRSASGTGRVTGALQFAVTADATGDGRADVLAVSNYEAYLHAGPIVGTVDVGRGAVETFLGGYTGAFVGEGLYDPDGDGITEPVVGADDYGGWVVNAGSFWYYDEDFRLSPYFAVTADTNGDLRPDLWVSAPNGVDRVSMTPGTTGPGPALTFTDPLLHEDGAALRGLGDVDGDGLDDLAVTVRHGGAVGDGLLTSGLGLLTLGEVTTSEARLVPAGDLDGDGDGDLLGLLTTGERRQLAVWRGPVTSLWPADLLLDLGHEPGRPIDGGGDFDGDGVPDLLTTQGDEVVVWSGAEVRAALPTSGGCDLQTTYAACPAPTATAIVPVDTSLLPALPSVVSVSDADVLLEGDLVGERAGTALVVADFDANGSPDLAVGAEGWASGAAVPSWAAAHVFLSTLVPGSATMESSQQTVTGVSDSNIVPVGAFDGDGDGAADLVLAVFETGRISVQVAHGAPGGALECLEAGGFPTLDVGPGPVIHALSLGDVDGNPGDELLLVASTVAWVVSDWSADAAVASVARLTIEPGARNARFSMAALLGDVDGDGVDEFALGAPYDDDRSGAVHLFSTAATGTLTVDDAWRTVRDDDSYSSFGQSVLPLGDADGDGVPDLVVGAPDADGGGVSQGEVHLLSGGALAAGGSLPEVSWANFHGSQVSDSMGDSIGVGDLNGDGEIDVAMIGFQRVSTYQGTVYVFHGPHAGSNAEADADFVVSSPTWGTLVYASTQVVPDLDGDGRDELAIYGDRMDLFTNEGGLALFYGR